ncbi:preprotein translocase subunit SecG [Phycisphaerales bacterium AB-hyl4]|uniref:Protein-export membrane protein SecG n=1 Tax=Natronomicrosphaera hydrolytica TaxID=3242702 RepID=A0ABV4U3W2_9BACT
MFLTLSFLTSLLAIAFFATCLLMVLVILIQKPKGGGLGSAFGGGGGGGTETAAFGAKTGDVLTWVTVGCFVLFLLLAMGLTWTIRAEVAPDPITPVQQTAPAPGTTGTPGTPEAPAEGEGEAAPEADPEADLPQQAPVTPPPAHADPANDVPDEPVTDELLPEAPEQPAVPEDAEPLLEDEAENTNADDGAAEAEPTDD